MEPPRGAMIPRWKVDESLGQGTSIESYAHVLNFNSRPEARHAAGWFHSLPSSRCKVQRADLRPWKSRPRLSRRLVHASSTVQHPFLASSSFARRAAFYLQGPRRTLQKQRRRLTRVNHHSMMSGLGIKDDKFDA